MPTMTTSTALGRSGTNVTVSGYMDYNQVWNLTADQWRNIAYIWNSSNDTIESPKKLQHQWPALCLFIIPICAVVGNIMVCMAVRSETKLQNMFNYFLVSLAISDMMSAVIVMPLSIIKAAIGEVPVPKLVCVTWFSLDVLFTSSTIIHLCMISVDRYISLQDPLRYGRFRQRKHTVIKITLVWVISFLIAGPLFLFSMFDRRKNINYFYKGCGPETLVFIISGTVTSFYLPLFIMTIMYILTVRALHSQTRDAPTVIFKSSKDKGKSSQSSSPRCRQWGIKTLRGKMASSSQSSNNRASKQDIFDQTPSPDANPDMQISLLAKSVNNASSNNGVSNPPVTMTTEEENPNVFLSVENNRHSSIDGSNLSIALESSGSSQEMSTRTYGRFILKVTSSKRKASEVHRGRKAVQTLGILFAVFVIFYLPFFAAYVITGTCEPCNNFIPSEMIVAFEWLAYSGSMVNPIIYHFFNRDFRKAFHRIMHQMCCRK